MAAKVKVLLNSKFYTIKLENSWINVVFPIPRTCRRGSSAFGQVPVFRQGGANSTDSSWFSMCTPTSRWDEQAGEEYEKDWIIADDRLGPMAKHAGDPWGDQLVLHGRSCWSSPLGGL